MLLARINMCYYSIERVVYMREESMVTPVWKNPGKMLFQTFLISDFKQLMESFMSALEGRR